MTNDISWDFHTNSTLCWTVSCRRCFALLLSASRCESTAGRELSDNRYRMRSEWKRCSLAWHCVCKFVGKDRRGVHTHTHTHPTSPNILQFVVAEKETWNLTNFQVRVSFMPNLIYHIHIFVYFDRYMKWSSMKTSNFGFIFHLRPTEWYWVCSIFCCHTVVQIHHHCLPPWLKLGSCEIFLRTLNCMNFLRWCCKVYW